MVHLVVLDVPSSSSSWALSVTVKVGLVDIALDTVSTCVESFLSGLDGKRRGKAVMAML